MNAELVQRIRSVRFTPVRLREGYDMGDVDRFLEEIAAVPPGAASTNDGANGPGFPVETTPTTSVIREQRGLLSRLFRRQS